MPLLNIPAPLPSLPALAAGLLAHYGAAGMAGKVILLPTRRAALRLEEILLQQAVQQGRSAVLLPCILAITDTTAIASVMGWLTPPPALTPTSAALHLAGILQQQRQLAWPQALAAAESLLPLAEELALHGITPQQLHRHDALTEGMAQHWQINSRRLCEALQAWQAFLLEKNLTTAAVSAASFWRQAAGQPLTLPVWYAGILNNSPPLLTFAARVLADERCAVVLAGADAASQQTEPLPAHHPQAMQQSFMQALPTTPSLQVWPPPDALQAVMPQAMQQVDAQPAAFLYQAMRPAAQLPEQPSRPAALPQHWRWCRFANEHDEAAGLALTIREALETKGQRIALVTGNRMLADKVQAILQRWEIHANDSAGTPLAAKPAGTFLAAVAKVMGRRPKTTDWIALLTHPYCRLGFSAAEARRCARALEMLIIRRLRGRGGMPAWLARAQDITPEQLESFRLDGDTFQRFTAALTAAWQPLPEEAQGFQHLWQAHQHLAEAFSQTAEGTPLLWQDEEGQQAQELWDKLGARLDVPPLPLEQFQQLLPRLLAGLSLPEAPGTHPRVFIWGFLEAQLQDADVVLLAGLDEDVPAMNPPSPWLPLPLRKALQLPDSNASAGQEAHSACQLLASAHQVLLTTASRRAHAPVLPSPWWRRWELAAGEKHWKRQEHKLLPQWVQRLDAPEGVQPWPEPAPVLPSAALPRDGTVSDVQLWAKNPYGFYARRVLALRELDPLEETLDGRVRGELLHAILHDATRCWKGVPEPLLPLLQSCADSHFRRILDEDAYTGYFWQQRFTPIAQWVDSQLTADGDWGVACQEYRGEALLAGGHPFTLRARADRLDRHRSGTCRIIDYKTGTVPSLKKIQHGEALQLLLESMIAAGGGFPGILAVSPQAVAYWHLPSGRATCSTVILEGEALQEAIAAAQAFVEALLAAFATGTQAVHAHPFARGGDAPPPCSYNALVRWQEWAS